jgi:hypothetical protein
MMAHSLGIVKTTRSTPAILGETAGDFKSLRPAHLGCAQD